MRRARFPYTRLVAQPHHWHRPPDSDWQETGPVFADPSGHRRKLMRVFGAAASVVLVGALIIAGIGLFGGPNTPFSVFGAPAAKDHGHRGATGTGTGNAPGSSSRSPTDAPSGSASRSGKPSPSPSPSTSRHRSATPTPTSSPSPTNPAGKTPPGQDRSKTPHPSPSPTHVH
jgi:hypothetical protein